MRLLALSVLILAPALLLVSHEVSASARCSCASGPLPPTPTVPTPVPTTPSSTPPPTPPPATPGVSTPAPPTPSVPTPTPSVPSIPPGPILNPINELITSSDWDALFPNRWYTSPLWSQDYNPSKSWYYPEMAMDYYSYDVFFGAVQRIAEAGFHEFANKPGATLEERKRELCAFLGNAAHETGKGTDGLFYREEVGYEQATWAQDGVYFSVGSRSDYRLSYNKVLFRPGTQLAGQVRFNTASYHGRGPLQLSWGYNYGDYSKFLYKDPQVLLDNPDKILDEPELGFGAAMWFWMTQPDWQFMKNPHKVMYKDTSDYSNWGFGRTIMAINGGLEQGATENGGSAADQKVTRRINNYRRCAAHFNIRIGVDGEQLDTRGMTP